MCGNWGRVWFEIRLKRRGKNNGIITKKEKTDVYKIQWGVGEIVDR